MKNSKLPSLVVLMILTLITTLFWVSFSVYRSFSIKPEPSVPVEIINPITPTLDKETIEKIKTRIYP